MASGDSSLQFGAAVKPGFPSHWPGDRTPRELPLGTTQ